MIRSGEYLPPDQTGCGESNLIKNSTVRYVREKKTSNSAQVLPKKRAKKHPSAPRRPMSAFLKFSQTWRKRVKKDNPDIENTDVSRLLGEMWRNATEEAKRPYREQEEKERALYKENTKRFRNIQARKDAGSRTSHFRVGQDHGLHMRSQLTPSADHHKKEIGDDNIASQLHPLPTQQFFVNDRKLDREPYHEGPWGVFQDQDSPYFHPPYNLEESNSFQSRGRLREHAALFPNEGDQYIRSLSLRLLKWVVRDPRRHSLRAVRNGCNAINERSVHYFADSELSCLYSVFVFGSEGLIYYSA